MKKSILNLGEALNKADQKLINGGTTCPSDYICYGENFPHVNCGTCEEYNALPQHCQYRVIGDCF